jgi:Raf kinase inhibitor-like YbhB/YbcL family protein
VVGRRIFTVESCIPRPETHPGEYVFGEYGCTGANRSPPLEWHDVPSGTKSFAITLFDIDEHGSPSGWWHWVVYNLPATTMRLSVNAGAQRSHLLPPGGVQGRGDSARNAYDGPCPDRGEPAHRYVFTIYALSVDKLPVPDHASGAMVSWTARKYTLAKATLVGLYGR